MILTDEDDSVLIEVSLCVDPFKSSHWLRESRTMVVAMGYLEKTRVSDRIEPTYMWILTFLFYPTERRPLLAKRHPSI